MPIPGVKIGKADFQTGVAAPSNVGVLAIIAACDGGTGSGQPGANVPGGYTRDDLVSADFGNGPLIEYSSYILQVGGKNVLAEKGAASTAGAFVGSVTVTNPGSSAITTSGTPNDDYFVGITFVTGGTIGVTGITYTYSADGQTQSGVQALGTANSITIPKTGVTFNLGAGTVLAGTTATQYTTRPLNTDADVAAALEGLRTSKLPWEGVLIDCALGTGTVGLVDTWLAGLENKGKFRFALLNFRHKTQPVPTAESETAYAAAVTAAVSAQASIRLCVGADAAAYTSTRTGWSQPRATAMFLAARLALIPPGEDPAFVGRGNIPGATIADGKGNPLWHDEDLFETLDAQRVVTLRSFDQPGPQGTFITNGNVLSPTGSDFVWIQHVRTANLAANIVWPVLVRLLGLGVGKKPKDPQTGKVYIQEKDAARIEALCNAALAQPLKGQLNGVQFKLSRTDDLSSNNSSTVTGQILLVALEYIKNFQITEAFVPSL